MGPNVFILSSGTFWGVGGLPLAARVAHLGSFVDAHFSENSINKRLFYVRTLVNNITLHVSLVCCDLFLVF